jgi:hypothetical protein
MNHRFLIDTDSTPDLGPISTRYQWCCNNGCGQCDAVLVEFRISHMTCNGVTEHEETEPRMVSSCCGESMFLWDAVRNEDGPTGYEGGLYSAAAQQTQGGSDASRN